MLLHFRIRRGLDFEIKLLQLTIITSYFPDRRMIRAFSFHADFVVSFGIIIAVSKTDIELDMSVVQYYKSALDA